MSIARKGDRVAYVETHPTNPAITRTHVGKVIDVGSRGAEVKLDNSPLSQGRETVWLRASQVWFVVEEVEGKQPVLSKQRPDPVKPLPPAPPVPKERAIVKRITGGFQSSLYKQEIDAPEKKKVAMPEPVSVPTPTTKPDPLEMLRLSGVDLLDLYEALGKRIGPEAQATYDAARAATMRAQVDYDAATEELRRARSSLLLAEQLLKDTEHTLRESTAAEAQALARLERVGPKR